MNCPCCGGMLGLLGKLGALFHYRCRACGMISSSVEGPDDA